VGRVWRRKLGCLRYWRFVHAHHSAEDHLLLLVLRRANPSMAPVTDRLEADHRAVSTLLDEVKGAATDLTEEAEARERMAAGLHVLVEQLRARPEYEEREAGPTVRRLRERLGGRVARSAAGHAVRAV
jgi:Hemerythrin HHE cation binding domain